jgi:hypothetical protein
MVLFALGFFGPFLVVHFGGFCGPQSAPPLIRNRMIGFGITLQSLSACFLQKWME